MKGFFFIIAVSLFSLSSAQCTYKLKYQSSQIFTDRSNIPTYQYTINSGQPQNISGAAANGYEHTITVNDGDLIIFTLTSFGMDSDGTTQYGELAIEDSDGITVGQTVELMKEGSNVTAVASCTTCPVITNLTLSRPTISISPYPNLLRWNAGGTETQWEIVAVPYATDVNDVMNTVWSTTVNTTTFEFTPNILPDNELYSIYVRALCGTSSFSKFKLSKVLKSGTPAEIPSSAYDYSFSNQIVDRKGGYFEFEDLDINHDNIIQERELNNVRSISLDFKSSLNLTPILTRLQSVEIATIAGDQTTPVDISQLINLKGISLKELSSSSIDLTSNTFLQGIIIDYSATSLTDVNTNGLNFLEVFMALNSRIETVDFSTNPLIRKVYLPVSFLDCNDLTGANSITFLRLSDNGSLLNTDVVSTLQNLEILYLTSTSLLDFDLSSLPELREFRSTNSSLVAVNFNSNTKLEKYDLSDCDDLIAIYHRNGRFNDYNPNFSPGYFVFDDTPALQYICVDDFNVASVNSELAQFPVRTAVVNNDCSLGVDGAINRVTGTVTLDSDLNGCDLVDPRFAHIKMENIQNGTFFSANSNGEYTLPLTNGVFNYAPVLENPTYFNVSPNSLNVTFPTTATPYNQDFCITPLGSIEDLEIIIVPLNDAVPGFDASYKVMIKNKGTVIQDGSFYIEYDPNYETLVSTSPVANILSANRLEWSFFGIEPFEVRNFEFVMNLNTPTDAVFPLNLGDNVDYLGIVSTSSGNDQMLTDNIFNLKQIVVNSFDPNDKTCLQGSVIEPSQIGDYIHYMIRFENLGTAPARNVIITDQIDITKFDLSSIVPMESSHDYVFQNLSGNEIKFFFENINLDFNDATNDGYVLFKIKTLTTLTEGDTFDNTAEIYFDFNFPIVTNTETVTIMTTASIGETTDRSISVYPNPAKDFITVSSVNNLKSATLIDVNGRTLSQTNFTGNTTEQRISLENLTSGVYFVTIQSDLGQKVEKVIVE
ncbi:putative repeat protein (TIGR01451 family)/predicted secreted protein (Por secretion system target) [Nonlabens dokdonensis]|uniref:Repeat protein (TIGR01451 family)/predicted secreted protein (Por secretion system target) n=2 Tax=Nonlabens dokdonensis TaxID=328515 RepID=A0ABX5PX05_9FLAO|nr:T9SS type A sorting domain-containing protein [Nonlabens dokdonensis]AGC77769.1 putative membrane-anchored cell surface protein [Nonlabens dokdonensis DSW-6]PZX39698.1 putative repeat protein (TIGR01451 family)/predicted secreted protein (Por secretion system target) [Nonlabens dokdonensis]